MTAHRNSVRGPNGLSSSDLDQVSASLDYSNKHGNMAAAPMARSGSGGSGFSSNHIRRRSAKGLLSGTQTPNPASGAQTPAALHSNFSSAYLGQRLSNLAASLEDRLDEQSEKPGLSGAWARQLIDQGFWVEEHLEQEWEMRKEAIGGIDNMWILMSSISNFNPVCTATFILEGKVDMKDVIAGAKKQFDAFPKYRQILTNMGRRFHGATFVDDPNFDIHRHLIHHRLPEPAGKKELDDFTASFIARDWDFTKPLWEMVIVDNYKEGNNDGSALVTRGHHTMADGQGFVMSQLYISSFGPQLESMLKEGRATLNAARRGKAKPSKLHKAFKPLDRYRNMLVIQLFMFAIFWTMWMIGNVFDMFNTITQSFTFSFHLLFYGWRPLHLTSPYNGQRVVEREFATSERVPISDVRKMQRAFSGPVPGGWLDRAIGRKQRSWFGHLTLNDIMCSVIADVLADELENQKLVPAPSFGIRIRRLANSILPQRMTLMIPISIRPIANWDMRNWSSGSFVWLPLPSSTSSKDGGLPLGAKVMHSRLHDVSTRLKVLKNGMMPTIAFWAVQITGQIPIMFPSPMWLLFQPLVKFWMEMTLEAFSAVVTNVPGPPGKDGIDFAQKHVQRWACSPPQAGKGTLGIGIISYADGICITIAGDRVVGAPSEGVTRRIADKFVLRWQQYCQVADDILERDHASKKKFVNGSRSQDSNGLHEHHHETHNTTVHHSKTHHSVKAHPTKAHANGNGDAKGTDAHHISSYASAASKPVEIPNVAHS